MGVPKSRTGQLQVRLGGEVLFGGFNQVKDTHPSLAPSPQPTARSEFRSLPRVPDQFLLYLKIASSIEASRLPSMAR